MILHVEDNTEACLTVTGSDAALTRNSLILEAKSGAKGLKLIAGLRDYPGPELWLRYSGHMHLAICTFEPSFEDKLAVQILVDLRQPYIFCEVMYLLPSERLPWQSTKGYAETFEAAIDLVVRAATECEQRFEELKKRRL